MDKGPVLVISVKKVLTGVVITICATSIIAAAKSIIDVEKLKVENKHDRELIIEVRDDVKTIKRHLFEKEN